MTSGFISLYVFLLVEFDAKTAAEWESGERGCDNSFLMATPMGHFTRIASWVAQPIYESRKSWRAYKRFRKDCCRDRTYDAAEGTPVSV